MNGEAERPRARRGALARTLLLAVLANGVFFFHGCEQDRLHLTVGFPVPFATIETRPSRLLEELECAVPAKIDFFSPGLFAVNILALAGFAWIGCRRGGPGWALIGSAAVMLVAFDSFLIDVGAWAGIALWPMVIAGYVSALCDPDAIIWLAGRAWHLLLVLQLSAVCRGAARIVRGRRRGKAGQRGTVLA